MVAGKSDPRARAPSLSAPALYIPSVKGSCLGNQSMDRTPEPKPPRQLKEGTQYWYAISWSRPQVIFY